MKFTPLRLLIIVILIITGMVFMFETAHTIPLECSKPSYHAMYVGWDDNAGPCTYMKRVSFDLFYVLVFPFIIAWPLTLTGLIFGATLLFRHKNIEPSRRSLVVNTVTGLLVVLGSRSGKINQ